MAPVSKIRMANPAHPGSFVKAEIIEAYGLSVTDAAKALGITRAALSAFINKHSALSPDMALRIENPCDAEVSDFRAMSVAARWRRPVSRAWMWATSSSKRALRGSGRGVVRHGAATTARSSRRGCAARHDPRTAKLGQTGESGYSEPAEGQRQWGCGVD